jgi:hypothetical protein
VRRPGGRHLSDVMARNLLNSMPLLQPENLEVLTSAAGMPVGALPLLARKRALAAVREVVALRSTRVGAELATFRKLKIKRVGRHGGSQEGQQARLWLRIWFSRWTRVANLLV